MRYRFFRFLSAYLQSAVGAVVRTVVTTFAFGAFVVGVLRFMGIPVPSAYQVLHSFEGLGKLARILS